MSAEFFDEKDGSLLPLQRREVFFYKGDDQCGHICICVWNIKQLNRMFSVIFSPHNLKRNLKKLNGIDVNTTRFEFQMSNALKVFQQSVLLELDTLSKGKRKNQTKLECFEGYLSMVELGFRSHAPYPVTVGIES